eukprot:15430641-Alexandrium_andersonii.AAC.1
MDPSMSFFASYSQKDNHNRQAAALFANEFSIHPLRTREGRASKDIAAVTGNQLVIDECNDVFNSIIPKDAAAPPDEANAAAAGTQNISFFGLQKNRVASTNEKSFLFSARLTLEGTRNIACVRLSAILKFMEGMSIPNTLKDSLSNRTFGWPCSYLQLRGLMPRALPSPARMGVCASVDVSPGFSNVSRVCGGERRSNARRSSDRRCVRGLWQPLWRGRLAARVIESKACRRRVGLAHGRAGRARDSPQPDGRDDRPARPRPFLGGPPLHRDCRPLRCAPDAVGVGLCRGARQHGRHRHEAELGFETAGGICA